MMSPYIDPFKKYSFLYDDTKTLTCPYCNVLRSYTFDFTHLNIIKCSICNHNFEYRPKYKKVYLSRTFDNSDTKYKYAVQVRRKYSGVLDIVDPLESSEGIDESKLVARDTKLLLGCDITVTYMNKITCGTFSEMIISKLNNKSVYLISHESTVYKDPWVKHWTDMHFNSVQDCYQEIVKECLYEIMESQKKKRE